MSATNKERMFWVDSPILSAGMNCDSATNRKYRLKKNLNCSYKTTGKKVNMLYFWLRTMLGGKRDWSFSVGDQRHVQQSTTGERDAYLEV